MPIKDKQKLKEYQAKYIRKHYKNNKEYYKKKAWERKIRLGPKRQAILNRYKLIKGCIDCGFKKHHEALDFDHVRGKKEFNLSSKGSQMFSWKRIKREVAKCEVRCANCHRIVTSERRKKSGALSS